MTLSRAGVLRPPSAITSSSAKLSNSSTNSGSVTASVDWWPGNSSSWLACAAFVMLIRSALIGDVGRCW